jgi:poly-gamma-glutamate synthesis protein (capsule biosynthesis protein)
VADRTGFIPVHVDSPGRPRVADEHEARAIASYLEAITVNAGLPPIRVTLEEDCAWIQ